MRLNLNTRAPCLASEMPAAFATEKAAYLRINFEKPDVPTTAAERDVLAKDAAVASAELSRGIEAVVVMAAGHDAAKPGVKLHASIRGFSYDDGRRSLEVSVEEADSKVPTP